MMNRLFVCAVFSLALAGCSSVDLQSPAAGGHAGAGRAYTEADFTNPASPLSKSSVYFDFDSYTVDGKYQTMLAAHAAYLVQHPSAYVVIEGNTDARGGREYNLALGQKRSDAVKTRLVMQGVPIARLESVSFGKERPKALGRDEASYQENRRADIRYQSK